MPNARRIVLRAAAGVALASVLGMIAHASWRQASGTPCAPESAASRDLYCMPLTPVPGLRDVQAELELNRVPSPFGITVTVDGRTRYEPVLHMRGLPDPATLGPYTTYVAWIASPTMFPVEKLGEVKDGRTRLPVIDMNEFLVLVSAEATADVKEREGALVVRGFSPGTRLQPADVYEFAVGSGRPQAAAGGHEHGATDGWPRPPMPPRLTMLPGEMQLSPPDVSPYLPRADDPALIAMARPRELVRLEDGDTFPLEARFVRRTFRGSTYIAYGFNGQVPGPLLHVPADAEIVVPFTNSIDWPATIHWHGVRLDNRFDGVPHITQEPVQPGETFTYRVRFRDEGVYWYHPHHREDILKELGLYGNLFVRPAAPDYWSAAHREEFLMLDDFLVGEEGPIPLGREHATHAMMGRFGNVLLVNGEPSWEFDARTGEVVRLYLTNVSNTRTFNVSLPGARMKVVGSDVGGFEREEWVESVVLAPAERYVVHVRFEAPGEVKLVNRVQALDHLFGEFFPQVDTLGTIRVAATPIEPDLSASFAELRENRYVQRDIDAFRSHFDRPVDRELVLAMEARDLPFVVQRLMILDSVWFSPVEWSGTMPMMNWASTPSQVSWILRDPATGEENMDISWPFRVGDVVKLRLRNARDVLHGMQHPIHIHGQRFLVLSMNGVPNGNLVWKDTVLLPAGSTADLLLEVSNPGTWMIHCHISEHLEAGMRMTFTAR
jgi:FtsP/CotA-like multicopper oxidase with cupredoxin domain